MATVLVVDDRSVNREFLATLLGYVGHEVVQAADGAHAFELACARLPDLVITDLMMPGMNGVELAHRLRAGAPTANIPLIFYTATYKVSEAHLIAQECGAACVLVKPVEPQEVLDAVAAVLGSAEPGDVSSEVAGQAPGLLGVGQPGDLRAITELQRSLRQRLDEAIAKSESRPASDATAQASINAIYPFALRLSAMLELQVALTTQRDPQAMLDLFCRSAQDLMNCRHVAVAALNRDATAIERLSARGFDDGFVAAVSSIDPTAGLLGDVMASGKTLRFDHARTARSLGLPGCFPPSFGMLLVPIPATPDRPVSGWIYLADRRGDEPFDLEHERFAVTMASQLATAYGNLSLYQQVQRHAKDLEAEMRERQRTAEALRESERRLKEMLDGVELIALIIGTDSRISYCNDHFTHLTGYSRDEIIGADWYDLFVTPQESHRRRTLAAIFSDDPKYRHRESDIRIRSGERRIIRWNNTLLRGADGQVTGLATLAEDVTDQRVAQAELEYAATHDSVTDLPLFVAVEEYLQTACAEAAAKDGRVVVLYVDLDRFHATNETRGRAAGDHVLRAVAKRLREAAGSDARVAHVAGDEFALVVKDPDRAIDQVEFGETVRMSVERPFTFEDRQVFVTCSVGVSCFPDNGSAPQELLRQAESAMLRAKDEGRNSVVAFANQDKQQLEDRYTLGLHLNDALRRGEFLLHYQPQINGQDWRISGVEALLRWQSPEFGLLTPGRFHHVAEDMGLMVEIGAFVLQTACRQAREWLDAGTDDFTISINVSPAQMQRPGFVGEVRRALDEAKLPARHIELELIENMMTGNVERMIGTMRSLKALGVKLSMDDFGTGYSSLNLLRQFPLDQLKIDQSFVRDISTDAGASGVCRAIITLAHQLGMTVLAEGVETAAQVGYLRRNDCDFFQGYYFCKPITAAQTLEMLRHRYLAHEGIEQPSEQKPTLLLVDDEENILNSLTRMLRRDGYRILTATGAEEALDILGRNEVQVVISDQRMPGISGTELLSKVKDMYPQTVRMVLSGYTDLQAVTNAINQGAIYKYLTKPWDDEELRLQVRDAFRIARREGDARQAAAPAR